jgi:hypothetical protein
MIDCVCACSRKGCSYIKVVDMWLGVANVATRNSCIMPAHKTYRACLGRVSPFVGAAKPDDSHVSHYSYFCASRTQRNAVLLPLC